MEYKFKQLKLTNAEKLWLNEIFKANFSKIDAETLRAKLWEQLPEDFDPSKIDNRLIRYNHLTLIGLWYVDPQNVIFGHISKIVEIIKELILKNPAISEIKANEIAVLAGITEREAEIALRFLFDLQGFFGSGGGPSDCYGMTQASFPQNNRYHEFLKFKTLYRKMEEFFIRQSSPRNTRNKSLFDYPFQQASSAFMKQGSQNIWNDYETSKRTFGKQINFVKDKHKREIIFRDIEHACTLYKNRFYKPATILAGSVIEELLRLYLKHKNIQPKHKDFFAYIEACEDKRLLKKGVSGLATAVRNFRNLIHLAEEKTKAHTISKATAQSAVASIFTIANDFQTGASRP
jgi:hypothetical protein